MAELSLCPICDLRHLRAPAGDGVVGRPLDAAGHHDDDEDQEHEEEQPDE